MYITSNSRKNYNFSYNVNLDFKEGIIHLVRTQNFPKS